MSAIDDQRCKTIGGRDLPAIVGQRRGWRRGLANCVWTMILAGMLLLVGGLGWDDARAQHPRFISERANPQQPTAARLTSLRFLTTNDFPPFNYIDESGALTGFHIDLARAICLDLSVSCQIVPLAWEALLPALRRGRGNAVIAGHMVSKRALASVDFTDRYFYTPGRFVGRRRGPELEITPNGLERRKIGVARGTTHEAYLQAFFLDSAIQRFPTQELARDALKAGKVDLIFGDGISLVLWINGEASRACCELKGGPFLEPKFFGDGIAIVVNKADRSLRAQLNASLRRLRASGRFEELVLRYFPYRVF